MITVGPTSKILGKDVSIFLIIGMGSNGNTVSSVTVIAVSKFLKRHLKDIGPRNQSV